MAERSFQIGRAADRQSQGSLRQSFFDDGFCACELHAAAADGFAGRQREKPGSVIGQARDGQALPAQ